ncbi:MAG: Ktr system potassium transporter B [Sphingopyxis sp.]|nr:MAG: Ktr system potassium transporter B [Sphingopyxis sp.]
MLALLYALLAGVGAALLKLPLAATIEITWMDALFTSVSAITVTGLVVVDTGSDLTFFGQAVVAMLIQLGGLGLMTFATLVLSTLGLPIGFEHRVFLKEDLGQTSLSELLSLVKIVLRVVLLCEALGVALISLVTVPEFGWTTGLWQAVFHSISAFNNAGFALFPDSLTRWATNPVINLSVPALYIIGGLGFGVLWDISRHRRWNPLTLHSKLMLVGTAGLLAWAFVVFAALEWNNPGTLGALNSNGDKLWVSWFQASTPRTAGFNTTDIAQLHDSTVLLFISLMLIGGGSTSTAGGIKVTTFIVLLLATYAFFRRRPRMRAFGRSLGFDEALKVMALLTVAGMVILSGMFVITISHDGNFLNLLFETVSAFGTVGLSRGSTGELDTLGRLTIITIMFLGRVGPLTLGFFLATTTPTKIKYPESKIYLG